MLLTSNCQVCGSRFGTITCGYCNRLVCSSCFVKEKDRCIKCTRMKKPPYSFLKRTSPFIALFVALWFFTAGVYPFPLYIAAGKPIDPIIMQPILIATVIMIIPFAFLIFAWKKRP